MTTEDEVTEYLRILMDATKQRSSPEEVQKCAEIALCIQEIYDSLKKHKINRTEDIVHTLISVVVIPVMMLEPDPVQRAEVMKQLAINFTRDILFMVMKDAQMKNTESGRELDKLRNMVSDSGIFEK